MALEDLPVPGEQQAALAGRHNLLRLQAKAGDITGRPDHLATVGGSVGVRTILDHAQSAPTRDAQDLVHLGGMTPQVSNHDRDRSLGNGGRDASGIQALAVFLAVHQDR
jgi:hypothetical protein